MKCSRVVKCGRCGRRYRGHGEWNVIFDAGVVTGHICPGCQTTQENAEAVINDATLDYEGLAPATPAVVVEGLVRRSEKVIERLANLSVDTGFVFTPDDAVNLVLEGLPDAYTNAAGRPLPGIIADIVHGIISGEIYADDAS